MENGTKQPAPRLWTRRQTTVLCALLALALLAGAAGAAAFLIDSAGEKVNTFLPGRVTCEVEETFDGQAKERVRVRNTGDTDAYIRVSLVSYYLCGGGVDGTRPAPALSFTPGDGWVLHSDGYYYYTLPVAGGDETGVLIEHLALAPDQVVDVIASAVQSAPARAVQEAWGVTIAPGSVAAAG